MNIRAIFAFKIMPNMKNKLRLERFVEIIT